VDSTLIRDAMIGMGWLRDKGWHVKRRIDHVGFPRWAAIAGLAALVVIGGVSLVLALRWPFTQAAVIATLQEKFSSTVEFKTFRGTYLTPGCIAEGVTFRLNDDPNAAPFATVEKLTIEGGYFGFFTSPKRIGRIKVEGLRVLVPSASGRATISREEAAPTGDRLIIGEIVADGAVVQFVSEKNPATALQFEVHKLRLDSVTNGRPMSFHAIVLNPEPPGEVSADGQLGPLKANDFAHIALSGSYGFRHANLGAFPGIAGTLSSNGTFGGVLGQIDVEGATDVPDFQVTTSGHPVHLNVQFHAVVNGANGDVALPLVHAQFEKTSMVLQGQVAGRAGGVGKTVSLAVTEATGRIEDWLHLFASSNRPGLTGSMNFAANVAIAFEQERFLDGVALQGDFAIDTMRFTRSQTQENVNLLSQRAEGEKADGDPASVISNLKGHIEITKGIARFSTLSFGVPGALAQMHGTYGLQNEQIDLHGALQLDARLSKGSTGIKSLLLTVVEPFLKKQDAGEIVPVRLTGSYTHPSYGMDY
jgi:hypothetical protein